MIVGGARYYTFSASAAAAFFASLSAFLALPDSFFAFPPFGAMLASKRAAYECSGRGGGRGVSLKVNAGLACGVAIDDRWMGLI